MDYLKKNIVVIGLGYVGLPLAVKLSSAFDIIGYDISDQRINELKKYHDNTNEITKVKLQKAKRLIVSSNIEDIQNKNIYIITVPTPVNKDNLPDLKLLKKACKLVGKIMAKNSIIIFESTVYPGVTKNICSPIIARYSGYKLNKNFFLGYSPERINPGDKKHSVEKITKVVSGSDTKTANIIGKIYNKIIKAGIFHAKSIEVAETAKAIENAQRDINIAFINEIALLCQKLNLSVYDVLDAAKTKWNFLPFYPGLVGGHCIGVDPYYLAQKAQESGYKPEIILSGRRINESMGSFVADEVIKALIEKNLFIKKNKILFLGITFKENCPDIRNTGVISVVNRLNEFGIETTIYDPWANPLEVYKEYELKSFKELPNKKFEAIILTVSHNEFININMETLKSNSKSIVYDVKGVLKKFTHKL